MQSKNTPIGLITGISRRVATSFAAATREPAAPTLLTGIEIEAEGVEGDPYAARVYGWDAGEDGSLRYGGVEWRLNQPLAGNQLASAIDGFYGLVANDDISFHPSPRAGTHIHVNLTDQSFGMVQAMTAIMYCIDQLVFEWADDNRMWCSYCNSLNTVSSEALRALFSDKEHEYINSHSVWPISRSDRYYGFNITSLFKFGTLEFRYFPTTTDGSKLWEWVDFCHLVFTGAQRLLSEIPENESVGTYIARKFAESPENMLKQLFLGWTDVLTGLATEGYEEKVKAAAEELVLLLALDTASVWEEELLNQEHIPMPGPRFYQESSAPQLGGGVPQLSTNTSRLFTAAFVEGLLNAQPSVATRTSVFDDDAFIPRPPNSL